MRWTTTIAALALALAGCAAQRAHGPLAIRLGLSASETAAAVRGYDFCPRPGAGAPAPHADEVFPPCDRPGTASGDAWVIARYQDGRVIRLQRFERWPDAARAQARWNQLIERYSTDGPPSQDARDRLFERQRIPDGTEAWVAFDRGEQLVGLYLLSPATPDQPSILEEIVLRVPLPPPPDPNPPR